MWENVVMKTDRDSPEDVMQVKKLHIAGNLGEM
jgi:hypothetical protein